MQNYSPGVTFGERLDRLIKKTKQPNGTDWTSQTVAVGVNAILAPSTSEPTTRQHIHMLRAGTRDSPRWPLVCALAELFNVPVGYFADERASKVPAALLNPDRALENIPMQRLLAVAILLSEADISTVTNDAAVRVALTLPAGVETTTAGAHLPAEVREILQKRKAIE